MFAFGPFWGGLGVLHLSIEVTCGGDGGFSSSRTSWRHGGECKSYEGSLLRVLRERDVAYLLTASSGSRVDVLI